MGRGYYYTVSIISQNSPFIKSKSRFIYIYFSFFIIESIIKKMITDKCADLFAHMDMITLTKAFTLLTAYQTLAIDGIGNANSV